MKYSAIAAILLFSGITHAATYYVATDGNDSRSAAQAQSSATPWQTVSYGVSQLSAGDELVVRGGVYREQVTVGVSGTDSSPVVICNYPGETPVIDGSVALSGWQRCTATDSILTRGGTVNPNYASIWRTGVTRTELKNFRKGWVYEQGRFLSPACDPDQTDADIQNLATFVPVRNEGGNIGQDAFLVDTQRFTQSAVDYWKDAFVRIYMNNLNGNTYTTYIKAYDPASGKITFQLKPSDNLHASDVYMIYNHPHTLDRAGEFCYTTSSSDGIYTIHVWPQSEASLDGGMSLANRSYGFYLNNRQWVTVKGFEIRNCGLYGAYIYNSSDITVDQCRIHSIEGQGVYGTSSDRVRVEDCHVSAVKGESGSGFGINLRGGDGNRIIRDTVWQSEHSAIYYTNTTNSIISDCVVEHWDGGIHNNGITVYTNSDNILVARNRAVYLRLNTVSDIYVYNNIFTGPDGAISSWGGITGSVHILNNMLTGTAWDVSLWGNMAAQVVYNNVIRDKIQTPVTNDYNIYLTSAAFEDKINDILADGLSGRPGLDDIVTDYDGGDFRLQAGCAAVDAGRDVMSLLPVSDFTDFRFDIDMAGNTRVNGSAVDIGPYEYHASPVADIKAGPCRLQLPNPLTLRELRDSGITGSWQVLDRAGRAIAVAESYTTGVCLFRHRKTGETVSILIIK